MKKIIVLAIILCIITVVATSFLTSRPLTQEGAEVVVSNLDTPWAIDFLPDGKMIFTERYGVISIFDEETRTIAKLPVKEVSESGLLGIAVDPEFEADNFPFGNIALKIPIYPQNQVITFIKNALIQSPSMDNML